MKNVNTSHFESLTIASSAIVVSMFDMLSSLLKPALYINAENSSITDIYSSNRSLFYECFKLIYINLRSNKIQKIETNSFGDTATFHLDISMNILTSINENGLSNLTLLKYLNLSSNLLTAIPQYCFKGTSSLQSLDISNNAIAFIHEYAFVHTKFLTNLISSWYLICCVAIDIDNCTPTTDYLSSCTDLLGGGFQRGLIAVQSILAISLNVIAAFMHLHWKSHEYIIFVHMSVADAMMGLYLGMIGTVDLHYWGTFNTVIMNWTQHYMCIMAGCMNIVASQMSLLLLLVLVVKRARNLLMMRLLT